jgi:hypothetical protein
MKSAKAKKAVTQPEQLDGKSYSSKDVEGSELSSIENTTAAKNFCDLIRHNVQNLSQAECKLLLAMADSGRELRVMAKAASRIWGDEFDGGTAEVAGSALYRLLLKRMDRFDDVHRPAPAVEFMGQINGYDVHFLKPDFVYRVRGNGLDRSFSPRYMPVAGMDIEDMMNVLDIVAEYEAN